MPKHTGLISHDPEAGITKLFHRLHDGDWVYQTIQDVEPILEANKAEQNSGVKPSGTMRKVASIPLVLIVEWEKKYGLNFYNKDHWPGIKALLNSNEYRHLRTDNSVL